MKKTKTHKKRIAFIFTFVIICILSVSLYLRNLSREHYDEDLKMVYKIVKNNELIGKDTAYCDSLLGEPDTVLKDNNVRIYSAGSSWTKVLGMFDRYYYILIVYYDKNETVTKAEIELSKEN